jgi:hypothetical protein
MFRKVSAMGRTYIVHLLCLAAGCGGGRSGGGCHLGRGGALLAARDLIRPVGRHLQGGSRTRRAKVRMKSDTEREGKTTGRHRSHIHLDGREFKVVRRNTVSEFPERGSSSRSGCGRRCSEVPNG